MLYVLKCILESCIHIMVQMGKWTVLMNILWTVQHFVWQKIAGHMVPEKPHLI